MCQVWVVDIKVSELCITCVLGSMVSTAVRWYVSYVHCKSGFVCKLLIADCAWWYVARSCLHPNAELSSHWLSPTLSVEILNRLTYSATPPAPTTQIGFPHIFKFQPRQYKKVSESLELRLNTEMPSAADDVHKKIVVYLWWLLLVISDQRYHLLWWETPLPRLMTRAGGGITCVTTCHPHTALHTPLLTSDDRGLWGLTCDDITW